MHFSPKVYAIDKHRVTIRPLKKLNGEVMGQREKMSELDIEKLNSMYCENFWRDPEAETDEDIDDEDDYDNELEDDENDGRDNEYDDGYSDDEWEEDDDDDDYDDDDDDDNDDDDDDDDGDEDDDDDDDDYEKLDSTSAKNDLDSNATPNSAATIYDVLANLLGNIETLYNTVKGLFDKVW